MHNSNWNCTNKFITHAPVEITQFSSSWKNSVVSIKSLWILNKNSDPASERLGKRRRILSITMSRVNNVSEDFMNIHPTLYTLFHEGVP